MAEPAPNAVRQRVKHEHAPQYPVRRRPVRDEPSDPLRMQSGVGFQQPQSLVARFVRCFQHTEGDLSQLIIFLCHELIISTRASPDHPQAA